MGKTPEKKKIISWCLFDFANSSYSAVISSVIFPVYYTQVVVGNEAGKGDLWWGRAISLSMAFVALTSPIVGSIADGKAIRKPLLALYTLLCILSTASLYYVEKGMTLEGFLLIVLANIGMEGGLVFYNSFLKDIVTKEFEGRTSSWGYGLGYLGSVISLIFGLILIKAGKINLVWPMVALFFLIFSMPFFFSISEKKTENKSLWEGLQKTFSILKTLWKSKHQRNFLIAYLLYEDGVNTIIVFSSIFAATTLGYTQEELIALYLIVQLTALAGAFGIAPFLDYWGPKKVLTASLIFWMLVCIGAYLAHSKLSFFLIASIAGSGLGVVQASSRAFFAQFIPKGESAGYFGLYSAIGKSSSVLGPALFGHISAITGSQRPSALVVGSFFIIGLLILWKVKGGYPNVRK